MPEIQGSRLEYPLSCILYSLPIMVVIFNDALLIDCFDVHAVNHTS